MKKICKVDFENSKGLICDGAEVIVGADYASRKYLVFYDNVFIEAKLENDILQVSEIIINDTADLWVE